MLSLLPLLLAAVVDMPPVVVRPVQSMVYKPAPQGFPAEAGIAVLEGSLTAFAPVTFRLRLPGGVIVPPRGGGRNTGLTVISGEVAVSCPGIASMKVGPADFALLSPPCSFNATQESVVQLTTDGPWVVQTGSAPPNMDAGVPADTDNVHINLVDVQPESGSMIGRNTVVRVTIHYKIDDFKPGAYHVMLGFEGTRPGYTIGAPVTDRSEMQLQQPSGTKLFTFDLSRLPMDRIRNPLRAWVVINRVTGENRSEPVVRTQRIDFTLAPTAVQDGVVGGAAPKK